MPLKQQIDQNMVTAAKSGEHIALNALRMLKAAITKFEVAGKEKKEVTDEDIQQIIGKEIKQRKDSIEQFKAGNRPELAAKEETEIKVLEKYLPAKLSEEELKKIIQEVIQTIGAQSKTETGKVMGALMPKIKNRADGGIVNKLVQEMLS